MHVIFKLNGTTCEFVLNRAREALWAQGLFKLLYDAGYIEKLPWFGGKPVVGGTWIHEIPDTVQHNMFMAMGTFPGREDIEDMFMIADHSSSTIMDPSDLFQDVGLCSYLFEQIIRTSTFIQVAKNHYKDNSSVYNMDEIVKIERFLGKIAELVPIKWYRNHNKLPEAFFEIELTPGHKSVVHMSNVIRFIDKYDHDKSHTVQFNRYVMGTCDENA